MLCAVCSEIHIWFILCDFVKNLICRTLYKQGPYGGRPVIRRSLIITPGSLVKVSSVLFGSFHFVKKSNQTANTDFFAAVRSNNKCY